MFEFLNTMAFFKIAVKINGPAPVFWGSVKKSGTDAKADMYRSIYLEIQYLKVHILWYIAKVLFN